MRNDEACRERDEQLRKQAPKTDQRPARPEIDDPEEGTLDKTLADSFPASDPPSSIPDPDEDAA